MMTLFVSFFSWYLVWPGLKLIHGVKANTGDPEYVSVRNLVYVCMTCRLCLLRSICEGYGVKK